MDLDQLEQKADFILLVFSISMNYHLRNDFEDKKAVEAAQKIADRYSEIKFKKGFHEAANLSKKEFLIGVLGHG